MKKIFHRSDLRTFTRQTYLVFKPDQPGAVNFLSFETPYYLHRLCGWIWRSIMARWLWPDSLL